MPLPVTRQCRATNVGTNALTAALRGEAHVFSGAPAEMAEYAGPSPKIIAGEAARWRHEDGSGTGAEAEVFTVAGLGLARSCTFARLKLG